MFIVSRKNGYESGGCRLNNISKPAAQRQPSLDGLPGIRADLPRYLGLRSGDADQKSCSLKSGGRPFKGGELETKDGACAAGA